MFVHVGRISVLAQVIMLVCAAAGAAPVQFKLTGTVTVYDPTFVLPAGVVTGAPFTAFLTYDTSVIDSLPDDPRRGRYDIHRPQNVFGLSLAIGDLLLRDDPMEDLIRIEVFDNYSPGIVVPNDSLTVFGIRSFGGPDLPDPYLLERIQVVYDNAKQDSWATDALPSFLSSPSLGRFEIQAYRGDEQPSVGGRPYDITATVQEVIVIPEPTTLALVTVLGVFANNSFRYRRLLFDTIAGFLTDERNSSPISSRRIARCVLAGLQDAESNLTQN